MSPVERNRGILVIDDDLDVREALLDVLESEGYEVVAARTGVDALAYLRTHSTPSLIFLDWNMAPMNATAFMAEFRRESASAHVPVVLITADAKVDHKVKTDNYEGFLRKPVDLDLLLAFAARFAG